MPSFTRAGIARSRPYSTANFPIVVDSPPGMINASTWARSSGVRTSIASTPSRRSILRCSMTSPWRARTPILGAARPLAGRPGGTGLRAGALRPAVRLTAAIVRSLPAPRLQQLGFGELADIQALHRLTDALGDARDHIGILVVRRRLDDRFRALRRVVGLEDAGAHEVAVAAELHHERE